MSAAPARRPRAAAEPAPGRPALRMLSDCGRCSTSVTEIRDKFGKLVRFDADTAGRAVRDPAGAWWAAKLDGRWCVVAPGPDEPPPTSGGAVRYREHVCDAVLAGRSPAAVGDDPGTVPVPGDADPVEMGGRRRPPGRGAGLTGPECPARQTLSQVAPGGGPPFQRMCIRCGRVTIRADGDGAPWCGGDVAEHPAM